MKQLKTGRGKPLQKHTHNHTDHNHTEHNHQQWEEHSNSNVNIQNGGYYIGSASNMSRLLIFIMFLMMICFSVFVYKSAEEIGELRNNCSVTSQQK
jgi:hypothetical protein